MSMRRKFINIKGAMVKPVEAVLFNKFAGVQTSFVSNYIDAAIYNYKLSNNANVEIFVEDNY